MLRRDRRSLQPTVVGVVAVKKLEMRGKAQRVTCRALTRLQKTQGLLDQSLPNFIGCRGIAGGVDARRHVAILPSVAEGQCTE